ncbi:acylphosphatase [Geothermobacter hydrogeniphilus]|uniref:acylphosphatase n=1 Tax=Geothermobacter hydrogeniphilus TaxID=1969733 RepID=A0A2K2H9R9_9BACT|nr:acylphosphatase [Geothermobacter hydrogeniphilus]PNU20052.1 acylphosphatase [Geothermobacter hydrogeniphilus]
MSESCAHLLISGRVQGVWYRGSTKDKARELGLTGWVRNLPDGRVEALACGPQEQIEALIQWCHQGPPAAQVSEVEVDWREPGETFANFKIR